MSYLYSVSTLLLAGSLLGAGCGGKGQGESCQINPTDDHSGCGNDLVCENVQGDQPKCFPPVLFDGQVSDLVSSAPVADARIVAIDANGAAASGVATSAADGTYSLRVPATRNPDGSVIAVSYSLRADASGYQSFPGGIRPALPISVTGTPMDKGLHISNALTAIGLVPLPSGQRGIIAGNVTGPTVNGILIDGGGATAISDRDGSFVLFNAAAGPVTVRGYAVGVQLNPANVTVTAGARTDGVMLTPASAPLATVSGNIELANAGSVASTSVLLVLKDTFNMMLERGEVPRGLRAGNVSNSFSIANVPDGDYAVLAAFENDGAVRDPDPKISGTQIVYITVPATGGSRTVQLPTSFKVTGALDVRSPGKDLPEAVTTPTPTFVWADDSSEDGYQLRVFDSFGNLTWSNLSVPRVTGSPDVSAQYAGPALVPGMYYQFRATSMKAGSPISRTEDLRGVFYLPKP